MCSLRTCTPASTLSKSLARPPFQGARFYHAVAVRFMQQQQHIITYADLGLGIRTSGRLLADVFRAPLDAIEAALPEELRKPAVNQYKVFTAQDLHAPVPFAGPRFTKEAPGGWDVIAGSAKSR